MFGLFNKKTSQPTVTLQDKEWLEQNLLWFIGAFGTKHLLERPYIPPTTDIFPYTDLGDPGQFQQLFEQLCKYWELDPAEISIKFFDDFKSKQWTAWVPQGDPNEPRGSFSQVYTTKEKRFIIRLAKSNLGHSQLLIAVLAHELAHVKLLGGNYITPDTPDHEPLTDLASIYFGFGIFVANSYLTSDIYWISRTGYLPDQLIAYANATLCYMTDHDPKNYVALLNTNTRELFRKNHEYLKNTNDTLLTRSTVAELQANFELAREIDTAFGTRDFQRAIDFGRIFLEKDPKNTSALNSLGYALLLQKKYEEAIAYFTKAIEIDPYGDYPINNRGYCKLQLGDLENAYYDLQHSFEMNPHNSFSYRNLGAYYLRLGEFADALEYFEHAEKIDPKTELINFYLGQAHLKLGNISVAMEYRDKSTELNEHNDSILAWE